MAAPFFSPQGKQRIRRRADAAPLRPEELILLRKLLRTPVIEATMEAREVARCVGLKPRAILDMVRSGVAFPNAFKPAHNRLRIPVSDVEAFIEARRVSKPEGQGDE